MINPDLQPTMSEETLNTLKTKKAEALKLYEAGKKDEAYAVVEEIRGLHKNSAEAALQMFDETDQIKDRNKLTKSQYKDVSDINMYSAEEKMFQNVKKDSLSMGKYLRGLVTGNWTGAEKEHEAAVQNSLSTGGHLVPTPLAEQIIDMVRAQSALINAGAFTIPMDSQTLKVARQIEDVKPHWKAPNDLITESEPQFDAVTFDAKTLVGMVRMPIELFEDAKNVGGLATQSLIQSLALELDRVGLVGTGEDEEPLGLYNNENINKQTVGTEITNFTPFSKAVTGIKTNNMTPNSVILSPTVDGQIDELTDTTGQPLQSPASYAALNKVVSTQAPNDIAVVGDFSKLWFGMRTNLTLEVSRTASDAFGKLQILIRAYLRADVQPVQDKAFTILDDIQ